MKAIILAAGEGSGNFREKSDKPMCLMPIGKNTLLDIQLNNLHKAGISDIFLIRGYKKEEINIPGINYIENIDFKSSGVLKSLFLAKNEIQEDVVILYSDIYYEPSVIKKMMKSKHNITLGTLVNSENMIEIENANKITERELIEINSDNIISRIGRNIIFNQKNTQGQFTGMIKLNKKGSETIRKLLDFYKITYPEKFQQAWLTDFFSEMISMGINLNPVIIETGWFELSGIDEYKKLIQKEAIKNKYLLLKTDWAQRSKKYDKLDWVNNDKLLISMLDDIQINKDMKILDIGTGTGKVLKYLSIKMGDADYYGCDINKEMMSKIKKEYKFKLEIANVENLGIYNDNFFDIITARMIFHHVNDMDRGMQEANKKLKPGGKMIICEGNPPSIKSYDFYKDMFFYKEDRNTLLESDLINLFARNGFDQIKTKTLIMPQMSLNNWLDNSGLPQRNIEIVKKLHYECDDVVREDYNMTITDDDILMDWKFSIVSGIKNAYEFS